MESTWKWCEDGVEFRNGAPEPVKLKLTTAKPSELDEFSMILEEAGRVYALLRAARNSFASGQADYTDAADNASTLLKELDRAGARAQAVAHGVDVFFDPPEISKHISGDQLIAFSAEVMRRINRADEEKHG
jgi:hypothetical protein